MRNSSQNLSRKGFILIEILIAALILTSSIAATMYLFRMGFQYLDRANMSNVLSSKVPQVLNLLKGLDLEKGSGTEDMGDEVSMRWNVDTVSTVRPSFVGFEGETIQSPHQLLLYKFRFRLHYKSNEREYEVRVFRFKRLIDPSQISF